MNRITGATFIIIRDTEEMLIQLRDADSKRYPNTWCFPGGTVESSEDEIKTIVREIKEEYGLELGEESCKELTVYDLSYGVSAKVFVCMSDIDQNPILHEGIDMRWMKLDEIKKLQLGFEQEKIIPKLEEFLRTQK